MYVLYVNNGRQRSEAHNVSMFPSDLALLNNGTKITPPVPRALIARNPRSVFLKSLARVQSTISSHFLHLHLHLLPQTLCLH